MAWKPGENDRIMDEELAKSMHAVGSAMAEHTATATNKTKDAFIQVLTEEINSLRQIISHNPSHHPHQFKEAFITLRTLQAMVEDDSLTDCMDFARNANTVRRAIEGHPARTPAEVFGEAHGIGNLSTPKYTAQQVRSKALDTHFRTATKEYITLLPNHERIEPTMLNRRTILGAITGAGISAAAGGAISFGESLMATPQPSSNKNAPSKERGTERSTSVLTQSLLGAGLGAAIGKYFDKARVEEVFTTYANHRGHINASFDALIDYMAEQKHTKRYVNNGGIGL